VKQRLQKILAQAGHGSRRSAEALIAGGRVRVNGQPGELGMQADPDLDRIEVDGNAIVMPAAHIYLAMHKPAGCTTTARDPHAVKTVMELLPAGVAGNVLPVGRLDRDTEGLLIFTSDGELAHRLAHPRYRVEKEYFALVRGTPAAGDLRRLRDGILIDDRKTAPATVITAEASWPSTRGGSDRCGSCARPSDTRCGNSCARASVRSNWARLPPDERVRSVPRN
jgi:16S rRNA U516 pseudouridylate synthase RsuA-like enzyme